MKRILILSLALLALAGCETVGGLGRDISKGADAMQRTF